MTTPAPATLYCPRCLTTFEADLDRCANLGCRTPRPRAGWGRIMVPGELFDRTYRILGMLAIGGAGVAYRAREVGPDGEETGPVLAIKVLLAARDHGSYVRRLANEAHILQELDHPNIVQYLGFVHRAGHAPYLITRFEEGGNLLELVRREGTLPPRRALGIVRQVCWALEKAHERGIVHRDLKPENVLLTRRFGPDEEPVVRVADFGIAKVRGSLGSDLTRVGAFVGTPLYAAPEQFAGRAATDRADVYSAGALLYFLLTGRHVVRMADRLEPAETYRLLLEHTPPRLGELPGVPPEEVGRIQRLLDAAMDPEPDRRCSARSLDEMIGQLLAGGEPERPPDEAGAAPELASTPSRTVSLDDVPAAGGEEDVGSDGGDGAGEGAAPLSRAAPRRRWLPVLLFLAAGALVAVAGGGAALALFRRPPGPPPVAVAADDPDPGRRADYEALRASLDHLRDWLARRCSPPAGTRMNLAVVVEADGRVRAATPDEASGALGRCVARAVREARFARTGDGPVRAVLTAEW